MFLRPRTNVRAAKWLAILAAADGASVFAGARVIRDFEKVNGISFNPRDRDHLRKVRGMGPLRAHISRRQATLDAAESALKALSRL